MHTVWVEEQKIKFDEIHLKNESKNNQKMKKTVVKKLKYHI